MIQHTFETFTGAGTIIREALAQAEAEIRTWLAYFENEPGIDIMNQQVNTAMHFMGPPGDAFSTWVVVLTVNITYDKADDPNS
jgi:hypothetical protein